MTKPRSYRLALFLAVWRALRKLSPPYFLCVPGCVVGPCMGGDAGRAGRNAEPQPADQARPSHNTERQRAAAPATNVVTRARLPRSGAQLFAQASLIALPDELLGSILQRAWADRPPHDAAEEVRAAAGLASVCRRWRELLHAQPLPLTLDFSAAPVSPAQRSWLFERAQAGRVEAANFNFHGRVGGDCERDDEIHDPLNEMPFLTELMARHGGTLLRLSGVRLHLLACASQEERPALDLSGLRLTKLGLLCDNIDCLVSGDELTMWLWPERLPGTLEELHLVGLESDWLGDCMAWAPRTGSGLSGRLPRLHTLRVTCLDAGWVMYGPVLRVDKPPPLLDGFPVLPAFEVDGSGLDVIVHNSLFDRVRSVRIAAARCVTLWSDREKDVATFVDRLCPAGLQAAELCAEDGVDLGPSDATLGHEVVRELISRFADRFAVAVGVYGDPRSGGRLRPHRLHRLAWRRWPAPGAPGLPAAREAHERASAWAADQSRKSLI